MFYLLQSFDFYGWQLLGRMVNNSRVFWLIIFLLVILKFPLFRIFALFLNTVLFLT